MFELSQTFHFDAAHTLRRAVSPEEAAGSRRIHGHTYLAEVTVRAPQRNEQGMVMDLAELRAVLDEVRRQLDHHFLDEVAGIGPATLENLCVFIHERVRARIPGVCAVSVRRERSGDRCVYRPA